jgi:hypothetical protein
MAENPPDQDNIREICLMRAYRSIRVVIHVTRILRGQPERDVN